MIAGMFGVGAVAEADPAAAAKHRKLVDAAQQFEAVFLQQMLKPMSGVDGQEDDSGSGESGQNGTLTSFGTEAVSKAIAAAGGFGVARHIVAQVEGEQLRHEGQKNSQTTLKIVSR